MVTSFAFRRRCAAQTADLVVQVTVLMPGTSGLASSVVLLMSCHDELKTLLCLALPCCVLELLVCRGLEFASQVFSG